MSENEKNAGTDLVPAAGRTITTQQIEDAGFMMPVADPGTIRAAFAERQRVLTSILDPERDFLYSVRYADREGKERTKLYNSLTEAKDSAAHLGAKGYSAHPKKSGVLKLAHALGIESKKSEVSGLPHDPKATFSFCTYIATHKRTGRSEEGQGYCDKTEKDKAHAIISMADTRAYCHAVLRCAGYDNVGAEEIELLYNEPMVIIENVLPHHRERPASLAENTQTAPVIETAPVREVATAPVRPAAPVTAPARPAAPNSTAVSGPPPQPDAPHGDAVITNSMAGDLSKLLLEKFGSKEKARAWLVTNAGVERSIHVREKQIGLLTSTLTALPPETT